MQWRKENERGGNCQGQPRRCPLTVGTAIIQFEIVSKQLQKQNEPGGNGQPRRCTLTVCAAAAAGGQQLELLEAGER